MADEEKQEEVQEEEPKKKGGLGKFLIILILVVIIVAAGTYFVVTKFIIKPPPGTPTPSITIGPTFDLEPFVVNLADTDRKRYLKVVMQLELENDKKVSKKLEKELKDKLPVVRDAIITLLSSKKSSDISTPQGKIKLKKEIIDTLNAKLVSGRVVNVYFTEFVIS